MIKNTELEEKIRRTLLDLLTTEDRKEKEVALRLTMEILTADTRVPLPPEQEETEGGARVADGLAAELDRLQRLNPGGSVPPAPPLPVEPSTGDPLPGLAPVIMCAGVERP